MMVWWDLSWISAKISEVRENISKYIADCNYKTRGASSESAKAGSKHRLIRCIGGLILKLSRPRRKWLIWSRCNPQCCDQISLAHERRPSDWNSSKDENSYSELGGLCLHQKLASLPLKERNQPIACIYGISDNCRYKQENYRAVSCIYYAVAKIGSCMASN